MNWLILLVGALILGYLILSLLSRPIRHKGIRTDDFPRYLASLMIQFGHGGLLFIERDGTDKFIQFVKYVQDGHESLNFGFPDAPWSRDYFIRLKKTFQRENVPFSVTETGRGDIPAFLDILDIQSIEEASRIAKLALQTMDFSLDDTFTAHFEGKLSLNVWRRNAPKYNKYL